ncbi:hypothetical protein ABZT03_21145 [Streptomyces sp. NPDC005574]|uniref:hypothetical protein n=1 Tax=Streptomyces sp. NPDC005574 TaxID=3156891 RepID=UPI0033A3B127
MSAHAPSQAEVEPEHDPAVDDDPAGTSGRPDTPGSTPLRPDADSAEEQEEWEAGWSGP